MALARFHWRPPLAASARCLRCFSSVPQNQGTPPIAPPSSAPAQGLVAILSESSLANKVPSSSQPLQSLGREAGLDRPTTSSQEVLDAERRTQFQRQIYRKWQPGDVYTPHDLSGFEQKKWKTGRKRPQQDAFDVLGINPIREYKNFTIMSEYMSETGRIKHSNETGLRPKNQRRVAKAVRRAIGLGLMPSVHRHPLVLKKSSPVRFL